MHQAAGMARTTTQAPYHMQETLLHGLPVRQDDAAPMEGQGRRQKGHKNSHTARADCLHGPIGVQHSWLHRPT